MNVKKKQERERERERKKEKRKNRLELEVSSRYIKAFILWLAERVSEQEKGKGKGRSGENEGKERVRGGNCVLVLSYSISRIFKPSRTGFCTIFMINCYFIRFVTATYLHLQLIIL